MRSFQLLPLLLLLLAGHLDAQIDTLKYDGMGSPYDGQLLAVTRFPGELDVIFNARFSPTERCVLEGVILGFSVVKFEASGDDTLAIWVFENATVPPALISVVKTYKVNLGDEGFPRGNVNVLNPLSSGARDELFIPLNPAIPFAPKRDFIIGVKLLSEQGMSVGDGYWRGMNLVTQPMSPGFDRYRRYFISPIETMSRNPLATSGSNVSLYLRAVVRNDAGLRDTTLTSIGQQGYPSGLTPGAVYPNPLTGPGVVSFTLPEPQVVRVSLHDLLGREMQTLADERYPAGTHAVRFTAGPGLPSGAYLLRITGTTVSLSRTLLLMR